MSETVISHPVETAIPIVGQARPMVSVYCITYNHSKFIAQAIEGFLMQQCTFDVEIVISDDCSTDGTREIIDSYVQRFPGRLRRHPVHTNQGASLNCVNLFKEVRGMYVALCDGDDYWTDPFKLQKQVDFLEKNPDYVICAHYTKEVDQEGNLLKVKPRPLPLIYTFDDLLINIQDETSTASMMYRNTEAMQGLCYQDWFVKVNAADKFIKLFATWHSKKKIYVMPEVMSCYRKHSGGIWSSTPKVKLKRKRLDDFYMILNVFTLTTRQKMNLLYFYAKDYLLFEVKHHGLSSALRTMKGIFKGSRQL